MNKYALAIGGLALGAGFFGAGLMAAKTAAAPSVVLAEPGVPEANPAFDAAIRDFLQRNPGVVVEAQQRHADLQAQEQARAVQATLMSKKEELLNDPASSVLGNPNGKVTLVEFYDYNCGFCRRGHEDMVEVLNKFPDVKVVLRQFPILGPESAQAHQVGMAFASLYPEKYQAFHNGMLTSAGSANEASAMQLAVSLGGDEGALRTAMADPKTNDALRRTYELANALNITGTPSYVIGDEVIGGAIGFEGLAQKLTAASTATN